MNTVRDMLFGTQLRTSLSVGGLVVLLAVLGGLLLLRPGSPFPADIQSKATFPLHYPKGKESGFTVDKTAITYDENANILIMPLTNADEHKVVTTEQAMPKNLTFQNLVGQGTVINDDARGRAAFNHVEGRMVASIISGDRKTLILLNSQDATKEELTALVRDFEAR